MLHNNSSIENESEVKYMIKRICCIGAGYVGGPTCAVIADQCPQIGVDVVDLDEDRIRAWNEGPLPIHEPDLEEIIKRVRNRNLFFSTNVAEAIEAAEMIFISVNTPTKVNGKGSGCAADLASFESAARSISKYAKSAKIIVEKSTVPCGTADSLKELFKNLDPTRSYEHEIISNPEFLAEGTAISDLLNPNRVIIGGFPTKSGRMAQKALAEIYAHWVSRNRILMPDVWSSELSKLTSNAMLAQRISSINSISMICERVGADIDQVAQAVGKDERIGSKFLKAGLGFGGSCFQKDILNLCYLAESLHLPQVSKYWKQVLEMNKFQRERIVDLIVSKTFGGLRGKKIAVLGFAFKKDTADTRESAAIDVVGQLLVEGSIVSIYDPLVKDHQIFYELKDHGYSISKNISVKNDPYEAFDGASAIVICTDCDEFRDYDYKSIYSMMTKPARIFDCRLVLDPTKMRIYDYEIYSIGKQ